MAAIIDEIVKYINVQLENGLGIPALKSFGVAYAGTKETQAGTEVTPFLITDMGFEQRVSISDNYPAQLYHRISDVTDTNNYEEGFGDTYEIERTYQMYLVFFYKNELKAPEIADKIKRLIPRFIPQSVRGTWLVETIRIQSGSTNHEKEQVFDQEFSGTLNKLPLKSTLILCNYTVTVTLKSDCGIENICE